MVQNQRTKRLNECIWTSIDSTCGAPMSGNTCFLFCLACHLIPQYVFWIIDLYWFKICFAILGFPPFYKFSRLRRNGRLCMSVEKAAFSMQKRRPMQSGNMRFSDAYSGASLKPYVRIFSRFVVSKLIPDSKFVVIGVPVIKKYREMRCFTRFCGHSQNI